MKQESSAMASDRNLHPNTAEAETNSRDKQAYHITALDC